jgi:hypothetical protein
MYRDCSWVWKPDCWAESIRMQKILRPANTIRSFPGVLLGARATAVLLMLQAGPIPAFFAGLYTLEDDDTVFLRNIGNQLLRWHCLIPEEWILPWNRRENVRLALLAVYCQREFSDHHRVILHSTKILLLTELSYIAQPYYRIYFQDAKYE